MTIRSLRSPARPDTLVNQVRPGQSLARRLYLAALFAGGGWIVFALAGSFFFMDADGLVVQDRAVVTSAFPALVSSVSVRPGDRVAAGQTIATVVSTQMLDLISGLTVRRAQQESRQAQIRARLEAIEATLPAAIRRASDAVAAQKLIDRARARGFATLTRQAAASEARYAALREAAGLRAERKALLSERAALAGDLDNIAAALAQASSAYRGGAVVAPVAGTIGSSVVATGTYMNPGENFAEVHHGKKYVVAYLPTARFYSVNSGEDVVVTDGVNRRRGTVERVEALADKLPPEFQESFRGVDRRQVFRVVMSAEDFPLLAKIKVVGASSPSALIATAQNALTTPARANAR